MAHGGLNRFTYSIVAFGVAFLPLISLHQAFAGEESNTTPAQNFYIVKEHESLIQISVLLYGSGNRWREIADHNNLKPPYPVFLGQKLKLKHAPTLNAEQGHAALLAYWRNHFGLTGDPRNYASLGPQAINYALAPVVKKPDGTPIIIAPPPPNLDRLLEERAERIKREQKSSAVSSDQIYDEAKSKFDAKDYKAALMLFRKSRTLEGTKIPPWMYELKCLKELNADKNDITEVIESFSAQNPSFRDLPVLKNILSDSVSTNTSQGSKGAKP